MNTPAPESVPCKWHATLCRTGGEVPGIAIHRVNGVPLCGFHSPYDATFGNGVKYGIQYRSFTRMVKTEFDAVTGRPMEHPYAPVDELVSTPYAIAYAAGLESDWKRQGWILTQHVIRENHSVQCLHDSGGQIWLTYEYEIQS